MIIRFPTGLYQTVLPKQPSDDQSVTFLISSTEPPRPAGTFQTLPVAEVVKRHDAILDEIARRDSYGELVLTDDVGTQTVTGSTKKTFEVGQILSFEAPPEAAPLVVSPVQVHIRHDTNALDLGSLGLSAVEVEDLLSASLQRKQALDGELVAVIADVENAGVDIAENQKDINEAQKALDAARVVYGGSSGSDGSVIIDKLEGCLAALADDRQRLIELQASLDAQAQQIRDELIQVSQLVR
jgi:hypothetical protein